MILTTETWQEMSAMLQGPGFLVLLYILYNLQKIVERHDDELREQGKRILVLEHTKKG